MEVKRVKVIMLPTTQASDIFKYRLKPDNKVHIAYHPKAQHKYWEKDKDVNQHLYFTSNEEIKEGDWYIYNNQVEQCKSNSMGLIKSCNNSGRNPLELLNIVLCRKIIASSDEALKIITSPYLFKNGGVCKSKEFNLPQPSQSFIKEYCDKGGIDEVNVEYEHDDTVPYPKLRLKVDSHNTITIHPIKDSWTREEVEELLSDLSNDIDQQHYHNFDTNNWIKQNL